MKMKNYLFFPSPDKFDDEPARMNLRVAVSIREMKRMQESFISARLPYEVKNLDFTKNGTTQAYFPSLDDIGEGEPARYFEIVKK